MTNAEVMKFLLDLIRSNKKMESDIFINFDQYYLINSLNEFSKIILKTKNSTSKLRIIKLKYLDEYSKYANNTLSISTLITNNKVFYCKKKEEYVELFPNSNINIKEIFKMENVILINRQETIFYDKETEINFDIIFVNNKFNYFDMSKTVYY